MYLDVLAAGDYLRGHGAKTVAVIWSQHGRGRIGECRSKRALPAQSDRLILLAPVPIHNPERITGAEVYAVAQGDPIAPQVKDQFEKAPEPKELLVLDGVAHAQFLFTTDQNERLMREILRFLSADRPKAANF